MLHKNKIDLVVKFFLIKQTYTLRQKRMINNLQKTNQKKHHRAFEVGAGGLGLE